MFQLAALGAGLAISAVGAYMQSDAAGKQAEISHQQADIAKKIAGEQQSQEGIRERASELDARRRRREIVRQSIIQRSQALSTATSQGASQSSSLQGAYGQIYGQAQWGLAGVNENLALSKEMFGSNRTIYGYRKQEADLQAQSADIGSDMATAKGISSIGSSLMGSSSSIGNLFDK